MFGYYLDLALRSLKRNKALTALMVLAIALGIGASMTTLTVLHVLSGNPLPGKSAHIYYPQIDPRDSDDYRPGEEPSGQLSYIDAMNLLQAGRARYQAAMTGGSVPVESPDGKIDPFYTDARYTTADFFPMFEVPMRYGHAWNAEADARDARVVVISSKLNDKLFAGADSVGRTLRVNSQDFRVIGVLGDWHPNPHFYDLWTGKYSSDAEDVYVPLTTAVDLKFGHDGNTNCWGKGGNPDHMKTASCTWLQFWVQLDTPAEAADYKQFLVHYSQQQKALGRFQRPPNVRLRDLMAWLDYNHVVPSDVHLQVYLAFGFLLVCLVNTVGLLLAKFLRRGGEIGVRRALGASRTSIFAQLLIEAGVVGLVGGLLGLGLASLGLWLVRQQPADYAALAHLDAPMLLVTFLLALGASLLAGLLPAWRGCQIAPALELKAQ
ncbi:MAG TPA: ABC transporter permease [Rhodanobacteraceae bacterium]|nr:ABC transporter permease [Rhodanobacteraceae bacterium]